MFCPHCGADVTAARFCTNCGAAVTAPPFPMPPPEPPRHGNGVAWALVSAGTVVVVALLAGILLLLRDSSSTPTATEPTRIATVTPNASPGPATSRRQKQPQRVETVTASPPQAPVLGLADVSTLQAGLFCRDLNAQGYSYVAAVDYWRMHGQPSQMDADRNGIPCETVYPAGDVSAYWGGRSLPDTQLTSGLFCRDLNGRGYDYAEAVAYWFLEGLPDRMDADLNGIPCETIYPTSDVSAYWSP